MQIMWRSKGEKSGTSGFERKTIWPSDGFGGDATAELPPLLALQMRLRKRKGRGGKPFKERAYEELRLLSDGKAKGTAA